MAERDANGRFPKGTSGNPTGRPKMVEEVRDLARTETEASIRTLAKIRDDARAPAQARVAAATALLDRGWGKPAQSHTVEGDAGLVVRIIKFADTIGYVADTEAVEPVKH